MQWSTEKAWAWYALHAWQCGFNYLPRTSVSYTDFWQTFDEATIIEELGWAQRIGFHSVRIVLSFAVWQADPAEMCHRFDRFLKIAAHNHLCVVPCLLDDCGFSGLPSHLESPLAPVLGVHNSRATASPGRHIVMDKTQWPTIERYVRDIVATFAHDERILLWDLYNEPGNRMVFTQHGEEQFDERLEEFSHELMCNLFEWARDISPAQPLTVAAWHLLPAWVDNGTPSYTHRTDRAALQLSDVISFHAYTTLPHIHAILDELRTYERPIFCTEWLARHIGSKLDEQLPLFATHNISCYQWGLVNGLTQTHIPWPFVLQQLGESEVSSRMWFHDLLHADGSPYDPQEVVLITQLTTRS